MSRSKGLTILVLSTVISFISVAWTLRGAADTKSETEALLNKAAEEIQVEISLGQLAAQRASNGQVKEFGQQMVVDHRLASQQIESLALEQGMKLSPGHTDSHQQKLEELSALSDHAFDREYMNYSLQDHAKTLEELKRFRGTVEEQGILQWMNVVMPILESHRAKAVRVKQALQTNP